jgi:23S rRNA pseudouridine1911/1915/1917 synthase
MSALRHPCCGDLTYGADPTLAAKLKLDRQWLHAVKLGFSHPGTGEYTSFTSEYAPELQRALDLARQL